MTDKYGIVTFWEASIGRKMQSEDAKFTRGQYSAIVVVNW